VGANEGYPVPRGYKHGDPALQVGSKCGSENRGTRNGEVTALARPAATVNYRPVLSSERQQGAPHKQMRIYLTV
jgi:hypothetical protein